MVNVYLICSEIGGEKMYKIGYTKRTIKQRIKEFKTGNASELTILNSFRSEWGTKIEAFLKRKYKKYNISGEWFILPDDEILNFNENCSKLHEGFKLLSENNTFIIENGW